MLKIGHFYLASALIDFDLYKEVKYVTIMLQHSKAQSAKGLKIMVRNVDHESRRRQILTATINRYIQKASPIASEDIASSFDLSSATIRNIFGELEESGYLAHPYTSGGRVPTEKGYRYYVDFLLLQMQLLDEEKDRISREFERQIRKLEDALEDTSGLIANITHYTGIVSFLQWQDKMFYKGLSRILEQPEFKDTNKIQLLIRLIEEKQQLLEVMNRDFSDKFKVYIGRELECPGMESCSLVVSSFGRKNKKQGRLAVLGPLRMEYNHIIPALEYISSVLSDVLENIE